MEKNKISTADIVLTGLFATLTFVGTMIRIPMPAAVGAPFIHLGNSVLLLAVLTLGFRKGALAGGMGFAIFDVMNGFAAEAPYFILESFVVGGVATLVFMGFNKKDDQIYKIIIVAISAIITKLAMTFLKSTVIAMLAGASLRPAAIAAFLSLPASLVNGISTLIIVTIAYYPVKQIVTQFYKRTSPNVNHN